MNLSALKRRALFLSVRHEDNMKNTSKSALLSGWQLFTAPFKVQDTADRKNKTEKRI